VFCEKHKESIKTRSGRSGHSFNAGVIIQNSRRRRRRRLEEEKGEEEGEGR